MPEGDTVWLTAHNLDAALRGQVLTRTDFRVPQLAVASLAGETVTEVVSRGKHVLLRTDARRSLHSHLRMDGSWHLYPAGGRWRAPTHAARVVLETASRQAVGFRVHDLAIVATDAEDELVGHLGPDLLGPDWDRAEALRRLLAEPTRTIGEALLDQRNLAGIGNLYKAESLFLRGINPWTAVGDVADLGSLVDTAQRLLEANKNHPEQSTTGSLRRGDHRYVFERARRPCLRCRTLIEIAEQGPPPQQRLTYWCPQCQPSTASGDQLK
ncbi:MAG: endonuclease [Frankiales bacterium]|nr:endonuclease [Frankiales bacterium]